MRQPMVMRYLKLILVLIYTVAIAKAAAQQSLHEKAFRDWDKNNDEKLSKAELPQNVKRNFDRVDVDNNGYISINEHIGFLAKNAKEHKKNANDWSGFKVIRDIRYVEAGHERQSLDLALPIKRKSNKPLPVIAYIHGGAWRTGNKNGGLNRLYEFLKSGEYIGVSIGYRLSQHDKWPAQIHDCKAAIRWIKANAKKYNFNGNRIAVHGTSAGGHLVAILGTSAGVPELDGSLGLHTEQTTTVRCVIDYFGPTNFLRMNDFESRIDHDAAGSPESQLIGGAIQKNKKLALKANPISYVDKGDAPFLIMHGTKDMLVPYNQSVILHKALKSVGVRSAFLTVKGGGHRGGGGVLTERFRDFLKYYLLDEDYSLRDEIIPVEKIMGH
ncbi:MAG: alpha/beta hydrolase fold domain-containing protein [Verrucomicrobiota bacterium]|nr:alpha/beta hydrolase fold domain-containing protein [Verrucomicrobiota bacterium]